MICTISGLWLVFYWGHFHPMLQDDIPEKDRDEDRRNRAIGQYIAFQTITSLLITCYVRAILVDPGDIPNDDRFEYNKQEDPSFQHTSVESKKKDGLRRHCKWCGRYKPDRCHHCRVCRTCILKMDHHCPWIYNCVGFHNYKYFFLVLFYAVIDLNCIFWWMLESLMRSWNEQTPFHTMFFLLYGESLVLFLALLITLFFAFHICLMFKGMTTIEFCESKGRADSTPEDEGENSFLVPFNTLMNSSSVYNNGTYRNLSAVLGPNPFLWFLPCSPPKGDGLTFESPSTKLLKATDKERDIEVNRGIRPKKKYQQPIFTAIPSYGAPEYSAGPLYPAYSYEAPAKAPQIYNYGTPESGSEQELFNSDKDYSKRLSIQSDEGLFFNSRPLV